MASAFDDEISSAAMHVLNCDLYDRANAAKSIIWAAHNRYQFQGLTGQTQPQIGEHDLVVDNAIREFLTIEALGLSILTTPANRLLDLLMSAADDSFDEKFVDLLLRELQPEICHRLIQLSDRAAS